MRCTLCYPRHSRESQQHSPCTLIAPSRPGSDLYHMCCKTLPLDQADCNQLHTVYTECCLHQSHRCQKHTLQHQFVLRLEYTPPVLGRILIRLDSCCTCQDRSQCIHLGPPCLGISQQHTACNPSSHRRPVGRSLSRTARKPPSPVSLRSSRAGRRCSYAGQFYPDKSQQHKPGIRLARSRPDTTLSYTVVVLVVVSAVLHSPSSWPATGHSNPPVCSPPVGT